MNVASTDRKAKHRFKPRSGTGCHRSVRTPVDLATADVADGYRFLRRPAGPPSTAANTFRHLGADKSLRFWKVYRRICHPAVDGPTVEELAPSAQSV